MQPNSVTAQPNPFKARLAISIFFFISGFNFAAWAARIPSLQKQLNLNEAELGTVLAALPFGLMLTMPLAGMLLNKVNSKLVLIYSSITYSVLLYMLGLAMEVWEAVLILFLFGASRNFFNISVNTQSIGVQKLFTKSIITSFHGIWSLAALTGAGISFLMNMGDVSMRNHFLSVTVFSLLLILIVNKYVLNADAPAEKKPIAFVMPDKPLFKLGFIGFISMVCEGTMSDWSGVYFAKVVKVGDAYVTTGYVAYLTAMVIGRFAGDWLVNRIGIRYLLQVSSIMIFSGFLIAVIFPTTIVASIGFLMIGFGVSCIMPLVFSLTPTVSKLPTGSAVAAISTVSYLGFLTGPPVVGYIAQALDLKISFLVSALVACVIFFIAYSLRFLTDKTESGNNL